MKTKTVILGISAYFHDSAATLLIDGKIVSAASEERFTRIKGDAAFPQQAISFCLSANNLRLTDVSHIVFYEKPLVKFERLLETALSCVPWGLRFFIASMPVWLKEKLYLKEELKRALASLGGVKQKQVPPLFFNEHHKSHAASAFYPSAFKKSAVLCIDGVGEWETISIWQGENNKLTPISKIDFPHSLGLLYSAFTYYLGFKVNFGEYKVMGLAPYGEGKYVDLIYKHLLDVKEDGSFRLNLKYFNYLTGLKMTSRKFETLFKLPRRTPDSPLTKEHWDIAKSIQVVTEEIVVKLAKHIKKTQDIDYLCMAGGVALNCVANGKLLRENLFKDIWVQPASGDAGGALGAALSLWHEYLEQPRNAIDASSDSMRASYLGPSFSSKEIKSFLEQNQAPAEELEEKDLLKKVASLLAQDKVVGWFHGKSEFGPRSLGGRSILGNPKSTSMQKTMNLKIKYRESFRPFAPAVKQDKIADWFEMDKNARSPYMLFVSDVRQDKRSKASANESVTHSDMTKIINQKRSVVPAITHVDYSARVQTVSEKDNKRFYGLLTEFEKLEKCPMLVNTSFNVRGEPIVNTYHDAYRCFMRTEMDVLVLENLLLLKEKQPKNKYKKLNLEDTKFLD